jgi:hypothetical protein
VNEIITKLKSGKWNLELRDDDLQQQVQETMIKIKEIDDQIQTTYKVRPYFGVSWNDSGDKKLRMNLLISHITSRRTQQC